MARQWSFSIPFFIQVSIRCLHVSVIFHLALPAVESSPNSTPPVRLTGLFSLFCLSFIRFFGLAIHGKEPGKSCIGNSLARFFVWPSTT